MNYVCIVRGERNQIRLDMTVETCVDGGAAA